MGFRIKAKYELNVDYNSETRTCKNSIPEFIFSECDDCFITNNQKPDTTIFVQTDRFRFCNIFNVIDQKITYQFYSDNSEFDEKREFFIKRGSYTDKKLQSELNKLDTRIVFDFKDTNKGRLIVKNTTADRECEITMNKNLLLITGLQDTFILLRSKKSYLSVLIKKGESTNTMFNVMRPVKEIKLYSKYLFNYKTEMCSKFFSELDLKSLHEDHSKIDVDFTISNLNSKLYKVDRFDLENCKFYFVDFFDDPLYFDYCELSVFFSNKG